MFWDMVIWWSTSGLALDALSSGKLRFPVRPKMHQFEHMKLVLPNLPNFCFEKKRLCQSFEPQNARNWEPKGTFWGELEIVLDIWFGALINSGSSTTYLKEEMLVTINVCRMKT